MKKIVALVLSLVMVLGLATVASAAVKYDVYNANGALVEPDASYTVNDAKYNSKVTPATGVVENIELSCWPDANFVECEKADADYYLTIADQDDAILYVKEVKEVAYSVGAEWTDIGTACGQLSVNAKYDYYYTVNELGDKTFYKGEKDMAGSAALLVAGELVQVSPVGYGVVDHDWEVKTVNAKHEVVDVVCDDCGVVATVYDTKLAAPKGAFSDATYGWLFIGPVADAPAAGDKVESAQTFDAGIAMYVGMSVMAAAGSAVVLKKKD